jgi:hypothetical protein
MIDEAAAGIYSCSCPDSDRVVTTRRRTIIWMSKRISKTFLPDDLLECLSDGNPSTQFRQLGKELGVAEAKGLKDVYKSHLEYSHNAPPRSLLISTLKISRREQGVTGDRARDLTDATHLGRQCSRDHVTAVRSLFVSLFPFVYRADVSFFTHHLELDPMMPVERLTHRRAG